MKNQTTIDFDPAEIGPLLIKQIALWGPIVVGLVHQFLMYMFGIDSIYVFVDPPGSIRPFVSVGYQWWLVLVVATTAIWIAAYLDQVRHIPGRLVVPTYLYLLFLLILVKPV